jgi:galactose mutarotase-like enzyme
MLYHIENETLFVSVDSRGAQLHSIQSRRTKEQYLWGGDPAVWYGQSPILFPFVGQLKDGAYRYEGKEYQMKKHGFARGSEFRLTETAGNRAVFRLESGPETLACYPFPFTLDVRYALEGSKLLVCHRVTNTGDGPMYFSIGAHPGFCCAMGDVLRFDEPETLNSEYITDESLLAGAVYPLLRKETDIVLTPHLFDRDALILSGIRSRRISLVRGGKAAVTFDIGGAPVLGIWAKPGAPYVCIEPWFGINDPDETTPDISQKRLIQTLSPGAVFEQRWASEFPAEFSAEA